MRSKLLTALFLILFSNANANANANATTYFSCMTKKGHVKLSVENHTLVYSLTKDNSEKFKFSSKGTNFSGFEYNYYYRYQTEYKKVSFNVGAYIYSIFSNFEKDNEISGVTVSIGGKEYTYNCLSLEKNRLSDLMPLLKCNKSNAMGCLPNAS